MPSDSDRRSISELRELITKRDLSSLELVRAAIARIESLDQAGPGIRAVIEINPESEGIARKLDAKREPLGPLHGIPILLKDNIETADETQTTAGSLALLGSRPLRDAFVAGRLRRAGAILLGKANLSEWANFRSRQSSSGWSGRGGQALNPYVLDRSPCGSSSGSASAVAAGYAPVSLGTETDGSILCPAGFCSVVGIKPTVGLTSRSGVIPIAHSQDTVGPFALTVADAAVVLAVIAGVDPEDPATTRQPESISTDYSQALAQGDLRGVRIGVPRQVYFGYSPEADAIVEAALGVLRDLGAELVDPADIPTAKDMSEGKSEIEVFLYEFKADLNDYLGRRRPDARVRTLADIIRFNEEHAAEEMLYFGQDIFKSADEKGPLTDREYLEALATNHRLSRREGIDAVMDEQRLDALVAPTTGPPCPIGLGGGEKHTGSSSQPAAMAGYPGISVPAGYASELPVGITFFGRAFSEPILIRIAHAYEQASGIWQPPRFLSTTA
jgi:amidase